MAGSSFSFCRWLALGMPGLVLLGCSLDTSKVVGLLGASSAAPVVSALPAMPSGALSAAAVLPKTSGKMVKVYLSAEPSHAVLFLDGQGPLALPYTGQLPAAPSMHHLRFEAPGFFPDSQNVAFERDFIFSVKLKPEPVKEAAEKSDKLPKRIADILGSTSGTTKQLIALC